MNFLDYFVYWVNVAILLPLLDLSKHKLGKMGYMLGNLTLVLF